MWEKPDWYMPSWVPRSSFVISVLLVFSSCITSTTFGYDASMVNGLNILPQYIDYFGLEDDAVHIGLNTASIWIGGVIAGLGWGRVTDTIGRRPAQLWAAVLTIIAVILQTAAQNIAMFVVARILVGFGTSASGLSGPAYLAETLPYKWRAWGVGVFNDFYYVGGLIAAGVTFGTRNYTTTWGWRIPSLVQGLFSIVCIVVLPFIPESPRWLVYQNRLDEARKVVAQTHADGDETDPIVLAVYKEITDTISWEKNHGETLSFKELVKTPSARKRVLLASSSAVFSTIAGNVVASYYLGTMLDNAGVTDTTTQLQINIILNAFCLVVCIVGTQFIDVLGRKPTTLIAQGGLTVFIFLIGGLTKVYGNSTNTSGIYGTVACIFLFQGAYSFGWTPVLYLYPAEVLNYPIRANGMGIFQFWLNGTALLFVFVMPIALQNISWKIYMINGAWDIVVFFIILVWWVETKGKTIEEVDACFDGKKTDVPDLMAIEKGKEDIEGIITAVPANEVVASEDKRD